MIYRYIGKVEEYTFRSFENVMIVYFLIDMQILCSTMTMVMIKL